MRIVISLALSLAMLAGCSSTQKISTSSSSTTVSTSVAKPAIVTRAEWGSDPDPLPETSRQTPSRITLHHAGELWKAGDDPVKKLIGLQKYGKNEKGWPDLPYHFLIAPDGRIFEGRDIMYQPESNTNYPLTGHIGINVWGNFEEQRISIEQLHAVVDLVAWLTEEYHTGIDLLSCHRDVAPGQTVCPGKDFYRYIQQGLIKEWVEEKLAGKTPDIHELPEAEGGPSEVIPGGTL